MQLQYTGTLLKALNLINLIFLYHTVLSSPPLVATKFPKLHFLCKFNIPFNFFILSFMNGTGPGMKTGFPNPILAALVGCEHKNHSDTAFYIFYSKIVRKSETD